MYIFVLFICNTLPYQKSNEGRIFQRALIRTAFSRRENVHDLLRSVGLNNLKLEAKSREFVRV